MLKWNILVEEIKYTKLLIIMVIGFKTRKGKINRFRKFISMFENY